MSFVFANPAAMAAAAADLASINTTVGAANALAAAPTTASLAAAADQVSAVVAAVFGNHAEQYQDFSAQMAAFHDRFVQALSAGAGSYANAEAVNALQAQPQAINAPAQTLLGP